MPKPNTSLYFTLKTGVALRIFISPRPRVIGFDEETLKRLRSYYLEVTYKPPKAKLNTKRRR